jgi:hypothetical protein
MEPAGRHSCEAPEYKHEIVRDGPKGFAAAEALRASCGGLTAPY